MGGHRFSHLRCRPSESRCRRQFSTRAARMPPAVFSRPAVVVLSSLSWRGWRGVCARACARTQDMDDAPTPPTVRKRAVARSTREGSSPALASGLSPFQEVALPPPPALSLPPPFRDPSSTPGLDRLRHQLIDELAGGFPLSLDAREYSVVLVCGDWEDSAQDWAALVLDVEGCRPGSAGTSREGLLFVKPLEMIPPDAPEPDDRDQIPRGGRKRPRRPTADPDAVILDERPPVVRLRLAREHHAQLLDAAAVMDRLRFAAEDLPERTLALPNPENPKNTRRASRPVGAAPDRGLPSALYDGAREPLRRRYAFSPGPALRRQLAVDGAPFPSSRRSGAARDAFLPSPQAPVFRDNPAFERVVEPEARAEPGAEKSRSGSRSGSDAEDEEVETWAGTSALRPRPGFRIHAPSPVPFPPPARDVSLDRSFALNDVPEEKEAEKEAEEDEEEEEEEEEEENDDDEEEENDDDDELTLSEEVGKGAAAALRRALETAAAGAVVLTLPIEDVKMVLAELENLQGRLRARTRR